MNYDQILLENYEVVTVGDVWRFRSDDEQSPNDVFSQYSQGESVQLFLSDHLSVIRGAVMLVGESFCDVLVESISTITKEELDELGIDS